MSFRIDVHLHCEGQEQTLAILKQLLTKGKAMSEAMDTLVTKVTALETVQAGAVTLLQTLKTELDAALASGDVAAIQALSDRIGTDTDALAAAVSANTPAATNDPGTVNTGG